MPEQSHPPYVSGAVTIPRQLERWLDVNPQNGPLKRTQTYVSVPAFSIEHVWRGYSEIVGEYHFEAPNNFSLKIPHDGDTVSIDTNYTMCVSYVNDDNTVVRYSLIRGDGDLFYSNLEQYDGQLVKKNFRVEIWNTSQVTCSEVYSTNIYTSVLGDQDYRYGTDSQLKQADPLCQGQQSSGTTVIEPWRDDSGRLSSWLQVNNGWTNDTWSDLAGSFYSFNGGGSASIVVGTQNLLQMEGSRSYLGTIEGGVESLFYNFAFGSESLPDCVLFASNDLTTLVISLLTSGSIRVSINSGAHSFDSSVLTAGVEYTMYFSSTIGSTYLLVYDNNFNIAYEGSMAFGLDMVSSAQDVILGNYPGTGFQHIYTRGLVVYNFDIKNDEPSLFDETLTYMKTLPSVNISMTLPLTWGTCAAPTLNT